ncbi:pyridoxamine 5'-phosphate oxidase family protein [Actinoallomurus sp. NPDC050550]|uniref:pyridoxamine 5'-phosphate oxidase family protein n=1 Tax=Actinoallomurus sp. NPDC050550 TaxID=3154937 RepID=UPI0033E4AF0F
MTHDAGAAQILDRDTCLGLLRSVVIGRVAWADDDGRVVVLPVNFITDGDAIIFRTSEGGKLSAVREGRYLSFEADDVEPGLRTGWSVLVSGTAQLVTDSAVVDRLEHSTPAPWRPMPKSCFIRLPPDQITGRRLPLQPGGVTHERIGSEGDTR